MATSTMGGPPHGFRLDDKKAICTNRTGAALVIGDVVELDLVQGEESDNSRVGNVLSSLANVDLPETSSSIVCSIYGVALEAIADDARGLIGFQGHFDVNVDAATVAGGVVSPQDQNVRTIAFAADERPIAIALEDDTSNISPCLFDGINGFTPRPAS